MSTSIRPAAALAALALACGPAAASGQLDLAFGGGDGYVLLPLGVGNNTTDWLQDVIVDSGGRLLAVGFRSDTSVVPENRDFVLVRLLPDGALDPAFGNGGVRVVAFDLGGMSDSAASVYETADGRYVACGTADTPGGGAEFAVARLLANGALDTSFDLDGRRTVHVPHATGGTFNQEGQCAATEGGGIVLAGATYSAGFDSASVAVLRLRADGSLDTGFNGSGHVVFDPAPGTPPASLATDVIVQADGAIVLTGATNTSATSVSFDMFAARLLDDGALDPDFGNGGVAVVAFDLGGSDIDAAAQVVPLSDGGFLLAGNAATALSGFDVALARLDAQGNLFPGFGTGGRALLGLDVGGSLNESASAAAMDGAGRIYLAGTVDVAPDNTDLGVLRLTPAGVLDTGFGVDGWQLFGIDNPLTVQTERGMAMALDPQERPVVVGTGSDDTDSAQDGLVVRLTSDRLFVDGFEALP